MEIVFAALTILGLVSLGRTVPVTTCEALTRPLEIQGREQLLGRWIFIGESVNMTGARLLTQMFMDNVWGRLTAASEDDVIEYIQHHKAYGRCFSLSAKLTLRDNALHADQPYSASSVLLNTGCPDCLVIHGQSIIGGNTYRVLQFLSRREKVSEAELQEFNKQVECLGLPSPAILKPEKGLCPEESGAEESRSIDLTGVMQDIGPELINHINTFMSNFDLKTLSQMFMSA